MSQPTAGFELCQHLLRLHAGPEEVLDAFLVTCVDAYKAFPSVLIEATVMLERFIASTEDHECAAKALDSIVYMRCVSGVIHGSEDLRLAGEIDRLDEYRRS